MSQFRDFLQAKISQYLYGGSVACFHDIEHAANSDLEELDRILERNAQDFEAKALKARKLQQKSCEILRKRRLRQHYKDLMPSILQGKVAFFHNSEHESFFQAQNATGALFQCCTAMVEFKFSGHCYNEDEYPVEDTFQVDLDSEYNEEYRIHCTGMPKDLKQHFPHIDDLIMDFANSADYKKTIQEKTVIDNFDYENDGCGPNGLYWTGTLPVYYVIALRSADCDK